MKRWMAIALILSMIGAAGVWFGLPVYAENQFRQTLDAWVASRQGTKAGYAVAKLDYWAGKATIGSMTEVIEIEADEGPIRLAITFTDLVIQDYDIQAAGRALRGESDPGDRIASLISWQSLTFANGSDTLKGRGGAGSIGDFAADRVDPLQPLSPEGLRFSRFEQDPIELAFANDAVSLSGTAGPFSVAGYDDRGFSELDLGAFEMGLASADDQAISVSWKSLSAGGLVRGAPSDLARLENKGFLLRFDLAGGQASGQTMPGLPGSPVKGTLRWHTWRVEGARIDEQSFQLWQRIFHLLSKHESEVPEKDVAALLELSIRVLERGQELQVGARKTIVENLAMDMGEFQDLSVERVEVTGARGLSFDKLVSIGQSQADQLGNLSTLERSSASDIDLSALPAYLRKVLGDPVTVETMDKAGDFYRDNTIASAIPAIDFGVWETIGQRVRTAEGQEVFIERSALERLRANQEGDVTMAFAIEGLGVDTSSLFGSDSNADMALGVLKSSGIENLKMNMALAVEFSPSRGELIIPAAGFGADGIARVAVSGLMEGLDVEQLRHLPEGARASALMSMNISKLDVGLTDLGGRQIAFALLGGQSGASPEEMAQALALQTRAIIGGLGSERAAAIGEAIGEFVLSGGVLELKAVLERPLPIAQLIIATEAEGPAAVLEILRVEAARAPAE